MQEPLRPSRRSLVFAGVILAACTMALIAPPVPATPLFDAPFHPLTVGEGARSVATADLNQDGWADLVVTNESSLSVSVLLATGQGEFQPALDYRLPGPPAEVVIGDVTADGVPDLIVALPASGPFPVSSGSFLVMAGAGNGTFLPAVPHPTDANPSHVAITDINHDGITDVLVLGGDFLTAASVQVFLGDAGDSLAPLPVSSLLWPNPVGFAVGDVNGDGNADLVTAHGSYLATVLVALGNGDGTFNTPSATFDSPYLTALTLADLDGNGSLDLVLGATDASGRVCVRLGAGDGSFGTNLEYSLGPYAQARAFAAADLDRDGRRDLVVALSSGLMSLPGLGNGSFGPATTLNCSGAPSSIAVADLDGDGIPDLAVAGTQNGPAGSPDALSVIFGDGQGGSRGPVVPSGVGCFSLATGDLNGDGIPDLVTSNFDGHTVSTMIGLGGARFAPPSTFSPGGFPWRAALGDLNGDQRPDLVITYTGDAVALSVQDGLGDGTFGPRRDYMTNPNLTGESFAAIADFNLDGKLDLAMVNRFTNTLSILLGLGNGTFPTHVDYPAGDQPMWIAVADVNRDGRPDVLVANSGTYPAPGNVSCHLGHGDGTFSAPVYYTTGATPVCVAAEDLDGDLWPDVVTRSAGTNTVSVLRNNGSGGYPAHSEFVTTTPGWWVGIGRIDGDPAPDLVAANTFGNSVSLLRGEGNGSFLPLRDFGTGTSPFSGVVADLNGDGLLDVAAANRGSSNVGILLHRVDIPVATRLSLVAVDARPDRVRLSWSGGEASVAAEVQRSGPTAPWTTLASVAGNGSGMLEFEDRGVLAGDEYDYRLVRPGSSADVLAEPVHVVVPPYLRFALEAPSPNPVVGSALTAWITLPGRSHATLELLDLAGRRVDSREVGALGPGRFPVTLGGGQSLAPGVYLIRLRTPDRSLMARAAFLK